MIVLDTSVLVETLGAGGQEALLPSDEAIPFGVEEAALAARLYRVLPRARGREMDLAIALAVGCPWHQGVAASTTHRTGTTPP